MKEKNLVILCIVLVILVSLVVIKKNMKPPVPTVEETTDIIEPSVSTDGVTAIELRLGDGRGGDDDKVKKVDLVKEGDHWIVKSQYGVYANDKVIAPVIDKVDQLVGELRSDNSEILEDYGISGDKALHVIFFRDGGLQPIHLVVGLEKPGHQNNFVRLGEHNAVYAVNQNLLGDFGVRGEGDDAKLDENKWVDKRIAHFDVNEIVGVSITQMIKGKLMQIIDLKKEDVDGKKQWKNTTPLPFGLSASKIKSLVTGYNNTYAREVVAPDVEGAFDEHTWTGVFTKNGGEQVTIVRGKKDEAGANYYLKHEGAPYYYVIPVTTFEGREKRQGSIFASNPLKVETGTVEELVVEDLVNKKKFHALKKVPTDTQGASDDQNDEGDGKTASAAWETPAGESVEESKVNDIINKIKNINVDLDFQPAVAVDDALRIRITKEGASTGYTITQDLTLSNGKECRFLSIDGSKQGFCASKSQIVALQNALP